MKINKTHTYFKCKCNLKFIKKVKASYQDKKVYILIMMNYWNVPNVKIDGYIKFSIKR